MVPGFSMPGNDRGGRIFNQVSKLAGVQPEGSKYSNPIFTLFQPPDFVYVINIVLSLLAILFAFDCISGEKESQTLKLMLTNSIPRDVILIGKWIGGTLSLLIPFMLSFAIGVLLVAIRPNIGMTGDAFSRVMLIFIFALLYISVFFLIGLVFSTFSARSSTALILSLFAWVFFVLIIPNLAPVISRQFVQLKTSDAIVQESERMESEMMHEAWKDGKGDNAAKTIQKMKEELPGKIQELEDRWLRGLDNQVKLAMNIARVSPSSAYIFASSAVSGTGVADYAKVKDEILRYRQLLGDSRKKFVVDDTSKPIPMLYIKVLKENMPLYEDRRLGLTESVNGAIVDFAILAVYLIVLFMIAFLKFLNYDVK